MTGNVIDFYEGAARALGFENFTALEEAHDAAFCEALNRAQAACTHDDKSHHSGLCPSCEDCFSL